MNINTSKIFETVASIIDNPGSYTLEDAEFSKKNVRCIPVLSDHYGLVPYLSSFEIAQSFLEDVSNTSDALSTLMGKAIANDLIYAAIYSDSTLSTEENAPAKNYLLGHNDGWHKMLKDSIPVIEYKILLSGFAVGYGPIKNNDKGKVFELKLRYQADFI